MGLEIGFKFCKSLIPSLKRSAVLTSNLSIPLKSSQSIWHSPLKFTEHVTPTSSTIAGADKAVAKAARRAKYSQAAKAQPTVVEPKLTTAHHLILKKFNNYLGKNIDEIPLEDCIEMQKLLTSTFRCGSIKDIGFIEGKLPILTNNPEEYLHILKKLEQRINQNSNSVNVSLLSVGRKNKSLIKMYNNLEKTDKKIVDLLHSMDALSKKESELFINSLGRKYGLSHEEQIRAARLYDARNIVKKGTENISDSDLQHIAYRIQSISDLKLFSILEPGFTFKNKDKLSNLIKEISSYKININQTSQEKILLNSKKVNLQGHNVNVCDIDDIGNVSGFFHTPESYGDGMLGIAPVKNDIYRRFGNFKYTFNKPTNDMPVCFTYGANGKYIAWADNGFFVNVPKGSIHAGGTHDLGSMCSNLDSCIDSYIFGVEKGKNNVGKLLQRGNSMDNVLASSITHNEFLCSNGNIQAFYTNDIKTMDKAYFEIAEQYNIPILNLHGKATIM